jgi:thymidylate synthase (FAD)
MQPDGPRLDWTGDKEIVRNARVSYDNDGTDRTPQQDAKLINYLYANRHTSPFEAMVFTFEIKAPIFVVRQWHRHRTWSYNEVSARYAELPEEFYVPQQLLEQGKGNKQMSGENEVDQADAWKQAMIQHCEEAFVLYKTLLDKGVSRELARTVLPLSTYTRMFGTVDLHNLLGFISLRTHPHAQFEIRQYAAALVDLINPIVPETITAFIKGQVKHVS